MRNRNGWLATNDFEGPSRLRLTMVAAAASVPVSVTSMKVWWTMLSSAAPALDIIRLRSAALDENKSVTPRPLSAFY